MRGPTVSVNLSYATSQLKPFLCWFSRLHREPCGLAQSGLGDSTSLSGHTPLILSRTLLIILNVFRLQAGQDNPLTHSGWGQSIQTKTTYKAILMGGGFEGVNARMPGVKITVTDSSLKCKKMVTERDSATLVFSSWDYRRARMAFWTRRDKSESSFLREISQNGRQFQTRGLRRWKAPRAVEWLGCSRQWGERASGRARAWLSWPRFDICIELKRRHGRWVMCPVLGGGWWCGVGWVDGFHCWDKWRGVEEDWREGQAVFFLLLLFSTQLSKKLRILFPLFFSSLWFAAQWLCPLCPPEEIFDMLSMSVQKSD